MNLLYRYDYFLIWGNGLQYRDEIIEIIESHKEFEIVKMLSYVPPKGIKDFVKKIYSYDYAPFEHLRGKTEYLLKTRNEVFIIFIRNHDIREEWRSNGPYFHLENESIREVKNYIRDLYNERKDDRRTENHVIHGSDNEAQADYLLKLIGYNAGTKTFEKRRFNCLPHHIADTGKYRIHKAPMKKIWVSTFTENGIKEVRLCHCAQYKAAMGEMDKYKEYLNKYIRRRAGDYYSIKKFENMCIELDEDSYMKIGNYVTVQRTERGYLILDGVHRASVLAAKGIRALIVMEMIHNGND